MSENLVDLAKSYFTDEIICQTGTILSETQQNTQKTFEGALPLIMSGLIQKASEPSGAIAIMDLIGELMTPNQGDGEVIMLTDNIMGLMTGWLTNSKESDNIILIGVSILQEIFEEKTVALTNTLAAYSCVKQSSAATIASLTTPVLLSILGQKITDNYDGISGLASLLKSQAGYVQSVFPSGLGTLLASMPGLGSLHTLTDSMSSVQEAAARSVSSDSIYSDQEPSHGNFWFLWLILILGVITLFLLVRSCS